MAPIVIDVARADDIRDVVHRTVQALVEGCLVALPTETVYGVAASACSAAGVRRLAEAKDRSSAAPFALAIKSAQELEDYAPGCSALAKRLARRCWPGPVTLVVEADAESGLVSHLPEEARQRICPNGTVGLRCPAHRIVQDVLRMIAGPLALSSANRAGEAEAVKADQAVQALGDKIALALDDGPAHYGQPSSVVKVTGNRAEMLREGVVGEPTLSRLSKYMVLAVCTGNTCRSPMAEGMLRKALAKELGASPDGLEERGVVVASAGIQAVDGAPPSREACELMTQRGAPIETHASQRLTEQLVRHADLLLTMTRAHRQAIIEAWPDAAQRTKLLLPGGADVADPIGCTLDVYRKCADQIEHAVADQAKAIATELNPE